MTSVAGIARRGLMVGASAAAVGTTLPRSARAADTITIGMPLPVTGPIAEMGLQMRHAVDLWAKQKNASGGLLGRKVEFRIEDTASDPAVCVRKAQEMVERLGCRLLMGVVLSSEALAVLPRLQEWNAILVSATNADGRLTAASYVPNYFRSCLSGPMETRAISRWLRQSSFKNFYALGMDYAWGHSSIEVFEKEVKKAGKNFIGGVFSPFGTKDFSTYITKIRQSGADACFLVLQGTDNNAFLSQAHQYRLGEKIQLLTSILDLNSIQAVGEAAVGLIGSTRYSFTIDTPANHAFVAAWKKEYGGEPDVFEGDQWQACEILAAGIEAAKSIEAEQLRPALEHVAIESVKGKVAIRACDHQGIQAGYIAKVVKQEGYKTPVPEIIATYSGEELAPACRQMSYTD